jgi:colicin import membrane protein
MATIVEEVRRPGEPPPDPFRYGWRYVEHRRPDGTLEVEQVPLTLEDVLHPQEGDQVTHSNKHERRSRYLCDVLERQLRHDPTALVLADVRIAWDLPELGAHGPDIAVILGVRDPGRTWSTFSVAEEGVRPALLIEITSPETATIDRSVKLEEYELAGVPMYVIVDGVSRRRDNGVRIIGFTLGPEGYRQLAPNERGWLWLAPARTWLGVLDGEIVCYDEAGQPLGDYRTLAAALAAEEAARIEAERRIQNETGARLAAEQRAQREAAARQVAEEQAHEARQLAEREAHARTLAEQRAASAEARLRQLEAELRQRRES